MRLEICVKDHPVYLFLSECIFDQVFSWGDKKRNFGGFVVTGVPVTKGFKFTHFHFKFNLINTKILSQTQLKESHTQISSLIQQQEISNNSIERLKMDLKLEKEKLHELAVATKQLLGNSHNVYSIFTELKETIVK
eukprot:TRINITY_DN1761_c0_g1_i4.p1 TRINITY_DN1761_c0_g1~~TRINITY_DN1761_c0_g1_i4.p1  ORF type:complete len:136 (-),score=18.10 TRINITY_DN1761_c0_g1_i4:96-503(-)